MRGELPDARQRDLRRIVRPAGPGLVRPDQPFVDQHVLPHAQRPQQHRSLQDLAGARVGHSIAIGPAPRRAIDPVDDIVPHVERVGPVRQDLDAIGIDISRRLERRLPPRCPFQQRGADRLGRGIVDIEGDRRLHARSRRGGVDPFQPETVGQVLHDLPAQRRTEIKHLRREAAAAWVERAGDIARRRHRDEAVPHHHRHLPRVGRDVAHLRAGRLAGIGLPRLELEVQRKGPDIVGVGRAQRLDQLPALFAAAVELRGDPLGVARQERRDVDQQCAVGGIDRIAQPKRGGGKGIARRCLLRGRAIGGAEPRVGELERDLLAQPPDHQLLRRPRLRAIEPDRGGAKPGAQRIDIQQPCRHPVAPRRRQRQQDAPALAVDMHRQQPVQPLGPAARIARRQALGGGAIRRARRDRRDHCKQNADGDGCTDHFSPRRASCRMEAPAARVLAGASRPVAKLRRQQAAPRPLAPRRRPCAPAQLVDSPRPIA